MEEVLFSIHHLVVKPQKRCILTIPSLHIPKGQITAVIGPNGAGKSTLLRALLGLQGGDVQLNRQPVVTALKQGEIAWVGQHGHFNLPLTVRDFVLLGHYPKKRASADSRLDELLNIFDLTHVVNQAVSRLSGGEQQRANIVRALLQDASVLLLDEPCNHLDIRHQQQLMQYLTQHKNAMTVIMVLHDLTMAAQYAQHIILLNQGQLVDQGTVQEVMTTEQLSHVYRWPIQRVEEEGMVYFRMNATH